MKYLVLGLNHRTASLSVREQIALGESRLREALNKVIEDDDLGEAVILSTCNRVEFYAAARHPARAMRAAWDVLADVCGLDAHSFERFRPHLYELRDKDAIHHLFRVASSLDSMVVGEPQILGQLKRAHQAATDMGSIGQYLSRAMSKSFSAAKRVRSETRIAESGVSISYVAAQLAQKIFGSLKGKSVLLVGAGEMAELAAKNLAAQGATRTTIANRSLDRAQALAANLGGIARPLEALPELLVAADIVITSTGSSEPVLLRKTLSKIMRARKYRPLFLIDIAVPRDVEPCAGELDNIYLYDIDDLEQVVASNMASRKREAQVAEDLVRAEVTRFMQWVDQANVTPTIVAMRTQAQQTKDAELKRAFARLGHLSERDLKVVSQLAHALTNKFLHPPTVALKSMAAKGSADRETLCLVQELFDLSEASASMEQQTPASEDSATRRASLKVVK